MKVYKVDIRLLERMLNTIPSNMDLRCIEFTADDNIRFVFAADLEVIKDDNYDQSLRELLGLIQLADNNINMVNYG